jgi:hypothetical protein
VSTRTDDRQYVYLDKSYDDLMKMNQGPANGSGRGDVYWVSLAIVEALRPGPRP